MIFFPTYMHIVASKVIQIFININFKSFFSIPFGGLQISPCELKRTSYVFKSYYLKVDVIYFS